MPRIISICLSSLLLLPMGCTADAGERCGQDVGCASGLYCKGDPRDDQRDPGDAMTCAVLRHPDDGVCHPAKGAFEACAGFWNECAAGLRCVGGTCQATGLGPAADPCR